MPRKIKKGYYVQGKFVAEGSELDLEYKAELRGTTAATRTDLKRESTELQTLGEALIGLRKGLMMPLNLPEQLIEALAEAKRITNFEGKRRQMQYIGKLMRKLQLAQPESLDAIRGALVEQHSGSAASSLSLHQAEQWRNDLIAKDERFGDWITAYPSTDTQQLRALIRQARKDAEAKPVTADAPSATPEASAAVATTTTPPPAPRHGRAYKEIFQLVREQLTQETGDDEAA
jgi:ribosome-associated protein